MISGELTTIVLLVEGDQCVPTASCKIRRDYEEQTSQQPQEATRGVGWGGRGPVGSWMGWAMACGFMGGREGVARGAGGRRGGVGGDQLTTKHQPAMWSAGGVATPTESYL